MKIKCKYYDEDAFITEFESCKDILLLSANIQSLSSKFSGLCDFIHQLRLKNVAFDVVALQEIWSLPDPDKFIIPGYQRILFKTRKNYRGGGVGFFIKNGLKAKVIDDLSLFNEKIFESICIQVEFSPNKKVNFISLYRPPGNHDSLTINQQIEHFFEAYEELLVNIGNTETYICTDSNIDLLKVNSCSFSKKYFESTISEGFINLISKATRFSSNHFSLIDQIITNADKNDFSSGVLIHDISDHFFTFNRLNLSKKTPKLKPKLTRSFSDLKIQTFNNNLSNLMWTDVLSSSTPEEAWNYFWNEFSDLFELHFPPKLSVPNKNFNKIQGFMTNGLLTSRRRKLMLYSEYILNRSPENLI